MSRNSKNVNQKVMEDRVFEKTSLGVKLLTAGTAACISDLLTFPLDTAKVRLQIQGEDKAKTGVTKYRNIVHTVLTIVKEEGAKSLYKGLSAGLQRQMCFASIRLGLYDSTKTFFQNLTGEKKNNNSPRVFTRVAAGLATGGMAVLFAQPTDVVKIRSQAMRSKNAKYRSTLAAYRLIYKTDGIRGLWQGTNPSIARNGIVNVSEVVCYDMLKEAILNVNLMQDNSMCHFTAGFLTGLFTTVVASPVDVIKTRFMNAPAGVYKNALHCAVLTFKNEGLPAFYKGFVPSFCRLVSWNIVMWMTFEKLKSFVILYGVKK